MLKGYVIGGEQVAAKFDLMPEGLQAALRKGITRAVVRVQILSKQKLNGEVLNVKTGRLRRSINTKVTDAAGKVEGIVGTNVEYAHIHEFGFHGVVTVREHMRRAGFNKSGDKIKLLTKSGNVRSQVHLVSDGMVRSHSMQMNMPERSFLRSALKELEPEVQGDISNAINSYLKAI